MIPSRYRGIEKTRKEVNEVLEDIKAEIEKAMNDFYYSEHDLGVRQGFRFALEIIDKHIGEVRE